MTGIAGTLVVVDGYGVLLRGPAGSGKSDAALTLIMSGQQLVADDAVMLRQRRGDVMGSAPNAGRGWLYLRGPGMMHIPKRFGDGAIAHEARIDLVVDLTATPLRDEIDGSWETTRIMDMACPRIALAPHRPIAGLVIAAVACMEQSIHSKRPVQCA